MHLLQLRRGGKALEVAAASLGADGADLLTYHRKTLVDRAAVVSADEEEDDD